MCPPMITLTENERAALHRLLETLAAQHREDVVGLFMYYGLFRELGEGGICRLADKIENKTRQSLPKDDVKIE